MAQECGDDGGMTEDIRRIFSDCRQAQADSLRLLEGSIALAADRLSKCLKSGGKILLCGNGGSAAEAQHFAAELINRFLEEREPLPAMALTTDGSVVTAIANDYAYEEVFAKQIDALGNEGDFLVLITTSGHSRNLARAAISAHKKKMKILLLSGRDGGSLASSLSSDCLELRVPNRQTPRIQEVHLLIIHCLCHLMEKRLFAVS